MRRHSKDTGVDCVQVELPMSVRTKEEEQRNGVALALALAVLDFHQLHYTEEGLGSLGGSWL